MHGERAVSEPFERVNRAGAMDQRIVRSCKLVNLHFEAEINSDICRVVVPLLGRIREVDKDAGIVVERHHHPLQPQDVTRWRWPREPQESEVGTGSRLKSAA